MTPPAQIVIFGASGDLTRRKLMTALSQLASEGHTKREFSVMGVARRPKSDDEFRRELAEAMGEEDRRAFESLAPRVYYQKGDARDAESLVSLAERLGDLPGGSETGRLFYLSLKPDLFGETARALAKAGLTSTRQGGEEAWRRVVIEKPFGRGLESARALNEELREVLRCKPSHLSPDDLRQSLELPTDSPRPRPRSQLIDGERLAFAC